MPSKAEKVPRLSWIGRQKKCIFLAFSDSFSHRLIHGNIAHLETKVQKGYNYYNCIQIILTNQHFKTNQHLTDPILQESSTCILELLSMRVSSLSVSYLRKEATVVSIVLPSVTMDFFRCLSLRQTASPYFLRQPEHQSRSCIFYFAIL